MSSPLMSKDAADLIGIKPQTLRKWRHAGKGPPFKRLGDSPGARCVYELEEIERWKRERTLRSTCGGGVPESGEVRT